tara:strand:+ start:1629 stop:1967 length:339 start_codon:yes stop_codon:yes gene_type:complete
VKQVSRKRKSALLQNLVRDKILKTFPHLKKIDVGTASHGQTGPDIILSKVAKKLVGCNFEIKNQQKMKTVYDWYRQASKGNHSLTPIVVCKMNTREPLVVLNMEDFFELIKS